MQESCFIKLLRVLMRPKVVSTCKKWHGVRLGGSFQQQAGWGILQLMWKCQDSEQNGFQLFWCIYSSLLTGTCDDEWANVIGLFGIKEMLYGPNWGINMELR